MENRAHAAAFVQNGFTLSAVEAIRAEESCDLVKLRKMTGRSLLYSSKVLMACVGLALGLTTVRAQSTVTLQGRVMDPNGAALVGARITSQDQATHAQRGTTTQQDGLYQIDSLLPGDYEIAAVSSDFQTEWRRVTLHVGDRLTVNFELPLAAVDERVEIREPR